MLFTAENCFYYSIEFVELQKEPHHSITFCRIDILHLMYYDILTYCDTSINHITSLVPFFALFMVTSK